MKILVVDDEPLARERLKRLLLGRGDGVEVLEAGNGIEAIAVNDAAQPAVILLDIRMPGMDGLEAARHIMRGAGPPAIIFCTAYDEYAIAAFESRAAGYLLKPVQREKLDAAIAATRITTRAQVDALAQGAPEPRRYFGSHHAGTTRLVPVAEVRALIADHKYVTALLPGASALLDESLREIENEFPGVFLRVHRNALVALRHVTGIVRRTGGECAVTLAGIDTEPQISRRHLAEVRARLTSL
ncbi:MAG: Transcriptional regulatory protein BtsR [Pseudomonadales bacterium]|nr:Transcriptional regulatory protein BtsR [Pseudomonadales bacterium]